MSGSPSATEPKASRPHMPGYGIPKSRKGLLPWSHVAERLEKARHYWIGTADTGGTPHAVPVWAVWVDDTLCFGGGPQTRWCRNLAANPAVSVHLESGDDVVILEGRVQQISDEQHPLVQKAEAASKAKYGMGGGAGFWILRPHIAYAWSSGLINATRWEFDAA